MGAIHDPNVSQEEVKGRFHYDPETGNFTDKASGKPAGSPNAQGYLYVQLGGRRVALHRVAFMWMLGYWPASQVDHVNGDRSDNRWANLRPATAAQNSQNRKPSGANFGFKGVTRRPDGRWAANAVINGKRQDIPGVFESAYAAHQAYAAVVKRMSGQYARLDGSVPANQRPQKTWQIEAQFEELKRRERSIEQQLRDVRDFIRALEPELRKAQERDEKQRLNNERQREIARANADDLRRQGLATQRGPITPPHHPDRR